jgi:putative sterol carrier protein
MSEDPRAMLQEAVKGRSDEEIMQFVATLGGVEAVLTLTFEGMKAALNPDKAQDCVIGYELTEDGNTHGYTVTIKDKQASYEKREPTDARVTLGLTVPDYLRLIAGELEGMQAFMQGKLKLKGDMMFAQQIPQMFGL